MEMDKTMISQFTEMFNKINAELDGVFKAMFGGGRASLSMVDPDDVLNTGMILMYNLLERWLKIFKHFQVEKKL